MGADPEEGSIGCTAEVQNKVSYHLTMEVRRKYRKSITQEQIKRAVFLCNEKGYSIGKAAKAIGASYSGLRKRLHKIGGIRIRMASQNMLTEKQRQLIIPLYRLGHSTSWIGSYFRVHQHTIWEHLKRYGEPTRPQNRKRLNRQDAERLKYLHRYEGYTYEQLGKMVGLSEGQIWRYLFDRVKTL